MSSPSGVTPASGFAQYWRLQFPDGLRCFLRRRRTIELRLVKAGQHNWPVLHALTDSLIMVHGYQDRALAGLRHSVVGELLRAGGGGYCPLMWPRLSVVVGKRCIERISWPAINSR